MARAVSSPLEGRIRHVDQRAVRSKSVHLPSSVTKRPEKKQCGQRNRPTIQASWSRGQTLAGWQKKAGHGRLQRRTGNGCLAEGAGSYPDDIQAEVWDVDKFVVRGSNYLMRMCTILPPDCRVSTVTVLRNRACLAQRPVIQKGQACDMSRLVVGYQEERSTAVQV